MNLSVEINVDKNNFLSGIEKAITLVDTINHCDDDNIMLEFSENSFVNPLFILPILVYTKRCSKNVYFTHLTSYMKTVKMECGMVTDKIRYSDFIAQMEEYATKKTYIPIINFPVTIDKNDEKDKFLSTIESIIIRQLKIECNVAIGLKYLISEHIDNIIEHADTDRGYIFAQAYPMLRYIDICIADAGITLLGSYKRQKGNEICSDMEAMRAANRGISTKNLYASENRGFGIVTSQKMLINGFHGYYLIMSGQALYIRSPKGFKFVDLSSNIRWNGTIVAFRLPYINESFQYFNYIE